MNCPTDQLMQLIRDELPESTSSKLQSHLSTCEDCQRDIESLAADGQWWSRATQSLSGITNTTPEWPTNSDSVLVRIDQASESSVAASSKPGIFDSPRHPEMLGRLDGFDVEEKIGQGGMGVVFRGFDSALSRPVAIKVLSPHLASSGVARKRFAREAQAAAAVVHPNVVPIYSVKDCASRPYIVMALVDGRSLQDHVSDNGPLPVKEIVRIAHQIAAGLAEAHKQGLIHRDIKPANILLEKDVSRVMITDFGLARAADDVAMTQTGWLAGTPHYMSPEQAKGKDIDRRSDLFSLGSVIYFMATGREPFRAEKPLAILQKIDGSAPLPARNINSEIPKTLDRLIGRLLEKDPENRIESAKKLEELLTRYLAHLQHPQSIAKPKIRAVRWKPTRFRLASFAIAAAVVVAAVIFLGAWLGGTTDSNPSKTQSTAPSLISSTDSSEADWMNGLPSFEQWNSDAEKLEQAFQEVETELNTRHKTMKLDPIPLSTWPENEFENIEAELQQLESHSQNQ